MSDQSFEDKLFERPRVAVIMRHPLTNGVAQVKEFGRPGATAVEGSDESTKWVERSG